MHEVMQNLPAHISMIFMLTTILTILLFFKASRYSVITLIVLSSWILIQAMVARTGFYTHTEILPPRFPLLVLPPVIGIVILFATEKGRKYIDCLDLKTLTILHIVRIPVELVLFWLFMHKAVPEIMTFEGRNFDILSGITAPVVYFLYFIRHSISRKAFLIWNFACLALLINIVGTAILAAPSPIQQLAFDQPNIGVFHFPFIWLPCCIVPLVLLSHLASIRQLVNRSSSLQS
jgi:hypothetical protein